MSSVTGTGLASCACGDDRPRRQTVSMSSGSPGAHPQAAASFIFCREYGSTHRIQVKAYGALSRADGRTGFGGGGLRLIRKWYGHQNARAEMEVPPPSSPQSQANRRRQQFWTKQVRPEPAGQWWSLVPLQTEAAPGSEFYHQRVEVYMPLADLVDMEKKLLGSKKRLLLWRPG